MNRRLFLKLAGVGSAAALFAKELFAQPPQPRVVITAGPPGPSSFTSPALEQYIRKNVVPVKPIFKVAAIWDDTGFEYLSEEVVPNADGYLSFTECHYVRYAGSLPADRYAIYAPMHGFERTGPWYLVRIISRREARQSRFTIAAPQYANSDLVPKVVPSVIDLPAPAPGQSYWRIHGPDYLGLSRSSRPASILIDIPESVRV